MRCKEPKFLRAELISELEEAHHTGRQVINICLKDHSDGAGFLSHLGILLCNLYFMKRTASDLEEAVQVGQKSMDP